MMCLETVFFKHLGKHIIPKSARKVPTILFNEANPKLGDLQTRIKSFAMTDTPMHHILTVVPSNCLKVVLEIYS